MTFNKSKYDLEYVKKNYKRVPLNLTKDKYQELKAEADRMGETVNGYIKEAIQRRMDSGS